MTEDAVRTFLDGAEVIQPPPTLGDDCPITALGRHNEDYFILDPEGQVKRRRPREFGPFHMLDLFGGDTAWLIKHFKIEKSRRDGRPNWDNTEAAAFIMRVCSEAGVFDPERQIRGPGVWEDEEGGLVVHLGDRLHWVRFEETGRRVQHLKAGTRIGRFVYPASHPELPLADGDTPGPEIGRKLLAFLCFWPWRNQEADPLLCLGHIGLQMLAGAVQHRPPLWIVGGSRTGKSTLVRLIRSLFDECLLYYDDPTAAGVRRELGSAARSVLFDEFELKRRYSRFQELVEMMRYAYTKGGGRYARGGAEPATGVINATFAVFAVEPPQVSPMDANRRVVLELGEIPVGTDADAYLEEKIIEARSWGRALKRRLIDRWDLLTPARATYRAALIEAGHDARGADTYGILLALAELMVSDEPVDGVGAGLWADRLNAAMIAEREDQVPSEWQLWNHLLTSHYEKWSGGERSSLGDSLAHAIYTRDPLTERTLRKWGIAIVDHDAHSWIAIANDHPGLRELLEGTRWAAGNWRAVLRRLPGAKVSSSNYSFSGAHMRATLLPTKLVSPPEQESATDV